MNKNSVYKSLAEKTIRYVDLMRVPVDLVQEKLVPIITSENLTVRQIGTEMYAITGNQIFVREKVAYKLQQASALIAEYDSRLRLEVVYGYRALSIQKRLFAKHKKRLSKQYTGEELMQAVHSLIAVPEVAGHPTGGAVDIQITKEGKPIDFGTKIWEFCADSFVFSPYIGVEAQKNRQLLRRIMMEIGFAPFDGEWWHFSYGDKEWAKYNDKPFAIYDQVEFKI